MSLALKPATPQYYYTITGDVVQGDNKKAPQYTQYATSRFPINEPADIATQLTAWRGKIVPASEISPLYESIPGIVPAAFARSRHTPVAANA